ncbi:unnamed protein product, partial [Closterium sp. Yama58-4]
MVRSPTLPGLMRSPPKMSGTPPDRADAGPHPGWSRTHPPPLPSGLRGLGSHPECVDSVPTRDGPNPHLAPRVDPIPTRDGPDPHPARDGPARDPVPTLDGLGRTPHPTRMDPVPTRDGPDPPPGPGGSGSHPG